MRSNLNTYLRSAHIRLMDWIGRDEGQGLTEYALVLVLIAIVAIGALSLLGGKVTSELSTIARSV